MTSTSMASYAHEVLQAPLIGSFFSLLFYGVSCVQILFYYQTYPDDNMFLMSLICSCDLVSSDLSRPMHQLLMRFYSRILETIQSGLTISFNNTYLIRGFGNMSVLSHIAWNLVVYTTQSFMSSSDWLMVPKVSCQVGLVVIFLVNMYFTWRVWKSVGFSEQSAVHILCPGPRKSICKLSTDGMSQSRYSQ
ncbi:hypothetical protein V8B97DRAFT_2112688 [Scleroderma yunnanense]